MQIYCHIVFSTKNRCRTLRKEGREDLFQYIWGILKHKNCHLYRINAVEDHIHLLTSIHPTVALADLIREIKSEIKTLKKSMKEDFRQMKELTRSIMSAPKAMPA